jgi:hypothetical protein
MADTVKTYCTTCNKCPDGTTCQITVTCKYNVKAPALSPDQIEKIMRLHKIRVAKKKLCEQFQVFLHQLNKALAAK